VKPGRGQGSLAKEGRLYFNIVQFPPPDATADEADLPEPVGLKSQSAPDHAGFVTTVRQWRRRLQFLSRREVVISSTCFPFRRCVFAITAAFEALVDYSRIGQSQADIPV